MRRTCKICDESLPLDAFYFSKRKSGSIEYRTECKVCFKAKMKQHRATEENYLTRKAYYKKNIERHRKINGEAKKRWREENGFAFRVITRMRRRVDSALYYGYKNLNKNIETIGCTPLFLRDYMEEQFKPGMTWDNRGEWHIDHVIPISAFDLSDPVQQAKCFHYTNLQPLWGIDNIRKGAKTGKFAQKNSLYTVTKASPSYKPV